MNEETRLAERVGPVHLRQRLGIEREPVAQVFGRGGHFFHIENWDSVHAFIPAALKLTRVYPRRQRNAAAITPRATRPKLIAALRMLSNKRDTNPPKKHGNIPL